MITLGEIAKQLNAKLIGDETIGITGLNSLEQAQASQLSYASSLKYLDALASTQASAVILTQASAKECPTNALVVDNPYLAFAQVSWLFTPKHVLPQGIDSSAITNNAKLANNCAIGKAVQLGENCIIGANTVIGDNTIIGDNVTIGPNVSIMHECVIGSDVDISAGAVIGSDGFGNARDAEGRWHKIAHLGKVIIGDRVTIGANTTIDRGTLGNTEIHHGVRLDNLIHIAHNVVIGENTAIAASTGIAGSTTLGKRCMIGGMVGIVGHLNICDDVIVNATSTVDKNITKPGVYTGFTPLMTHKKWQNVGIWLTKLDKICKHLNIKLKHLKG